MDTPSLSCPPFERCADTAQLLSQWGRFDLVSMMLAGIGIILVLGGIVAYLDLRSLARRRAQEEASKATQAAARVAEETAERVANEHLQAELPDLIAEHMQLVGSSLSDEDADDIAHAQDEPST